MSSLETRTCACVSSDAKECIRRRYSRYPVDDQDDEYDYDDEQCECGCHYQDEDDHDDFI